MRTYTSLPPLIDVWFQFLFHSPLGVLFTFPSRYLFTIGHQVVFSLIPWSGLILTEFHVLHDTRDIYLTMRRSSSTRLSLSMAALSRAVLLTYTIISQDLYLLDIHSHYPHTTTHTGLHGIGLGFSHFAHHYYGNHIHFLFLALLRCFSSCRSPLYPIYSDKDFLGLPRRVSPFGNLRIKAHLPAPRSLSQAITSFIAS